MTYPAAGRRSWVLGLSPPSQALAKTTMSPADQHLLQETIARVLRHLAGALQDEAAGSRRWVRLIKVLEEVETLERLAQDNRNDAAERLSLTSPPPTMRAQRLGLVNLLSGSSALDLSRVA